MDGREGIKKEGWEGGGKYERKEEERKGREGGMEKCRRKEEREGGREGRGEGRESDRLWISQPPL
jgi:hypothetical protein